MFVVARAGSDDEHGPEPKMATVGGLVMEYAGFSASYFAHNGWMDRFVSIGD